MDLGLLPRRGTLRLLDDRWTQSPAGSLDDDRHGELRTTSARNGSTAADKYGIYYQTTWQFTPRAAGLDRAIR